MNKTLVAILSLITVGSIAYYMRLKKAYLDLKIGFSNVGFANGLPTVDLVFENMSKENLIIPKGYLVLNNGGIDIASMWISKQEILRPGSTIIKVTVNPLFNNLSSLISVIFRTKSVQQDLTIKGNIEVLGNNVEFGIKTTFNDIIYGKL